MNEKIASATATSKPSRTRSRSLGMQRQRVQQQRGRMASRAQRYVSRRSFVHVPPAEVWDAVYLLSRSARRPEAMAPALPGSILHLVLVLTADPGFQAQAVRVRSACRVAAETAGLRSGDAALGFAGPRL